MTRKLALFLLAALLLTACAQSATAPTSPTPSPAAPPEATVAPTAAAAAPTQEPTAMPEPTAATPSEAPAETDVAIFRQLLDQANARAAAVQCPTRTFPLPDPPVSVKRPLDFSSFNTALQGFSPEQAGAIATALDGKTTLQIQALMADGQLTSEQLVLSYLARIQQYDEGRLNAVMELNPEALTIAQALDAERGAGTVRGPLHGIPVLLKDNIATAGPLHTTAGNYALKDWQADRDAFLVTQLRDAGAVILGKSNLSEWANYTDPCMPSGFSTLGGQTRNPHGPYDTLGSSSGSAVAVAAELTTVSVGSETAGSIVQPSRANGVVGLRPSKGLVSGDYIIPLEPTLDTAGPIGRSVTDVAVLLSVLAATDSNDPDTAAAAELAAIDFTQYLSLDEARKLRVGAVMFDATIDRALGAGSFAAATPEELQVLMAQLQPIFQSATQPVIDALKGQGIEVVTILESELPTSFQGPYVAYIPYGFREGISRFFSGLGAPAPVSSLDDVVAIVNEDKAARAPYGQGYVEGAATTAITAEQYQAARAGDWALAEAWLSDVAKAYNVDVLLFGVNYTNLGAAGVPALNIPTGRLEGSNEPTGVYLTGPRFADAKLIAVGYALEQALNVRLVPDLDKTIAEIDTVTGR
jgi:amidase